MDRSVLIEVTVFKTKLEVDQTQFLAADAAFTEALKAMGGFIQRDLLQGENDVWIDIIHWRTLEDAQHSAATIASHPEAQAFIHLLDKTYSSQMMYVKPTRFYR
jgi:heme-degrading monooxygenase HmoA